MRISRSFLAWLRPGGAAVESVRLTSDYDDDLSMDDCDTLGLNVMKFQYDNGRNIRFSDLTDAQRQRLANGGDTTG